MKKVLFFGFPLSLLFFSCSKELEPTPGDDSPVFNVLFTAGSEKNTISAGLENIYLFTNYEIDSSKVNLTGTFSNVDCRESLCPGTLKFIMRLDKDQYNPQVLNYSYLRNMDPSVSFQTLTVAATDTTNRDFNIQLLGQESTSSPLNVNIFDTAPVELKVSATDRTNLVKSAIKMNYLPEYPDSCHSVRLLAKVENGVATFRAEINGTNLNYSWNNGVSDTSDIMISDITTFNNSFEVTVTSPDAGCQSITSLSNLPQNTGNEWISSTGVDISTSGLLNSQQQTGVKIEWTDINGNQFSSADFDQSFGSYFKILNIEPYQLNENGQQTLKLSIEFKCLLIGQSSSSLEPLDFSGMGTIGVSIPQF